VIKSILTKCRKLPLYLKKEPSRHIGSGPRERGNFFWGGDISRPIALRSIGNRNILREPKLFGRMQQRCGLSLSVPQQLVTFKTTIADLRAAVQQ